MLESDAIISLHLSKIICGCKSLLNLEAVCHAAMDMVLQYPWF